MAKSEFCMLAHKWDSSRFISGWLASEKLDGMRALWIPSTRGLTVDQVDFANREKDERLHICTGLWSRLRKPIFAPSWWLDMLPSFNLDGELWIDRGMFQDVMSICKTLVPGLGWNYVKYMIIDAPGLASSFEFTYNKLIDTIGFDGEVAKLVVQKQLPFNQSSAIDEMEKLLSEVSSSGGEGLMLRRSSSIWVGERSWDLLKVKKFMEGIGTVTGYTFGRHTDKGSRLLGKMGALVVNFNGKRLELSGFTDEERELVIPDDFDQRLISSLSGKDCPASITNPTFVKGSVVRFKYRELSNDGVPKEARYWR